MVEGDHQRQRPDQVRGDVLQGMPLSTGFEDQPEIHLLKVAQATVDQFGGAGGGAAGKISYNFV